VVLETAVFDRARLLAGNVIQGPAVIEEAASTTVVEPGDRVVVNKFGLLVMSLASRRGFKEHNEDRRLWA
jgi:N-methylhydantoinase A